MATTVTMLDPNNVAREIPADQKDAALKAGGRVAVKMFDPSGTPRWISEDQKDDAIKAGGKMYQDIPTVGAFTESDITANPHHEGTYAMVNPDGKTVQVPYSQVRGSGDPNSDAAKTTRAIKNLGYRFANDAEQKRFLKDLSADPKYGGEGYGSGVVGWLHEHGGDMTVGALREAAKTTVGLSDLGYKVEDYLFGKKDRKATESETSKKIREFAATEPRNVPEKIGGMAEQVGEIALPEAEIGKVAEGTKIAKAVKGATEAKGIYGAVAKTSAEAAKAATEQGAQAYVKSGGDTEEAKRAAEVGGVVGAAIPLSVETAKKLGSFSGDVGRFFLKVGDMQTGVMVRETEKANEAIAQKLEEVRKDNAEKIAKADKDYEDQLEKAKKAHEKSLKDATAPTERAQADNVFKEEQARLEHAKDVEKARLEHEQSVAEQQAIDAKAEVANRKRLELRGRLASRLHAINSAAQNYFKRNYSDVENIVNKVDDKGAPHLDESNTVPMEDLAEAVHSARGHLEGSDESIKVFNDITKKIKGIEKAESASGLTEHELENLSPDELAELHREGGAPPTIGFTDLKGYYSELGRMLASPSVPGDVKQAAVALRDSIDKMQQDLADKAGVGSRYKLLRNQYRNYAKGFLDYQGPNASGSPVAYALKASDAHNATKGFIGMEPEEASRVKQILSGSGTDASKNFVEGDIETAGGKKEPAWRYRKNTSKLLDEFLKAHDEAETLGKQAGKEVGEFVPPEYKPPRGKRVPEPKDVGEFQPPARKGTKLTPEPEKEVLTPEEVRKRKEENLVNRASLLNHFGTYMAVSGLVGSVFALTGGDPAERVKRGAEGILVGAVSPYLMAKLVERPDVVSALSKVTRKDLDRLMKLPADQRSGVEEAIRQLAETAQKKGKLDKASPWLRIIGGTAARNATAPAPSAPAASNYDDIQKDLQNMRQGVTP